MNSGSFLKVFFVESTCSKGRWRGLAAAVAVALLAVGCVGSEVPGQQGDAGPGAGDVGSDAAEDSGAECSADEECAGTCRDGSCVAPTCQDGVLNGKETGKDCGGGECPPCQAGKPCDDGSNCKSQVCGNRGLCVEPTCTDGTRNGAETATDCGGPDCDPCGKDSPCSRPGDCRSGLCTDGTCSASTCDDQTKGGAETDVDCGGPECSACGPGDSCQEDGDCRSGVCEDGSCQAGTCDDGVKNGKEVDVDCGGPESSCPKCPPMATCNDSEDCAGANCTNGMCVAPTCMDGISNAGETGVDCGGPMCPKCSVGESCEKAMDCKSGVCPRNPGTCQQAACDDGTQNGSETDVDCGGPACAGCAAGASCQSNADCRSGLSCTTTAGAKTCSSRNKHSVAFDGSSSQATAPPAASMNVGKHLTMEAWIKPDAVGGRPNIMGRQNSAYRLRLERGKVWLLLRYQNGGLDTLTSRSTVPAGTWTHVAVTFDGTTGQAKFYIDGNLDKTAGASRAAVKSNTWAGINFGYYEATNSEHFDGKMDEFRIWDTTRTASEIQSTMKTPLQGNESGLIGYWDAEAAMSSALVDRTSNGNDAPATSVTYAGDTPF